MKFFKMATLYQVIFGGLAQQKYFMVLLYLHFCSHVTVMWYAPPTYRVPSVRRRAVWSRPMGMERGRGHRSHPTVERRALDRVPRPAQQTQTMKMAHPVAHRWIPPSPLSLHSSGERLRAPTQRVLGLTWSMFTPQPKRRKWPHRQAR